jgi:phosphatidylserine decarboxylase
VTERLGYRHARKISGFLSPLVVPVMSPLSIQMQHLLPKQWLTQAMGALARAEGGTLTHAVIRSFVARYRVDMSEAADPRTDAYPTFNAFFTRALRPGARPLADASFVCPVDGAISQFGPIEQGQIFQAKGHHYSASALLGGDEAAARRFDEGHFATLYLSPRDYHRIHMPCDGTLTRMVYVPGTLYSVNPLTARHVPGLFARNERVVCLFDTPHGPLALVLVGATIVGSMATVWHGVVNPPRAPQARRWNYEPGAVTLRQGDEMGRFLLGSTVVMLFPRNGITFNPDWAPARPVRLGEAMATLTGTPVA